MIDEILLCSVIGMKIYGFHRRRLGWLMILIGLGIWMDQMTIERWNDTMGVRSVSDAMIHWSTLSWSQSWIELFTWPPIGDIWMEKAYDTNDRLRWAVYAISDRDAQAQLAEAARVGTDVRIMLEEKPYSYTNDTYDIIDEIATVNSWFQLQSDEILDLTYLHAKYFIFDDSAVIQTANLTRSGLYRNLEHAVLIHDVDLVESLIYIFEQDRKGEEIDIGHIDPRLVLCPHDCRMMIEGMITSAEDSIDIMTQYIYDESVISLLKETDPDIDLRLLLSDSSGNQNLVDYFGNAVAQMYYSSQHYLHTKAILIDDQRLLVGSMNLSQNALDNNREIGIIITDPTQISAFKKAFERYRQ